MPFAMLGWKKRTPQCREVDAATTSSSEASEPASPSGHPSGLVRLTDILKGAERSGRHSAPAPAHMTVDARVDSRRKPLFREWTLKKSTSTTTATDDEAAATLPALQPGSSQDDLRELRAVEEQFRRGGDPSQVTQWLAAMTPPSSPPADSAEADRELARRPLGELAAMERQLQRLEAQQGLQGQQAVVVRRESERLTTPRPHAPRRPVTRTHSDSAPPEGPTPRVQRRWANKHTKRAAVTATSPQPSPAAQRRGFNYHLEVTTTGWPGQAGCFRGRGGENVVAAH